MGYNYGTLILFLLLAVLDYWLQWQVQELHYSRPSGAIAYRLDYLISSDL